MDDELSTQPNNFFYLNTRQAWMCVCCAVCVRVCVCARICLMNTRRYVSFFGSNFCIITVVVVVVLFSDVMRQPNVIFIFIIMFRRRLKLNYIFEDMRYAHLKISFLFRLCRVLLLCTSDCWHVHIISQCVIFSRRIECVLKR